jgi:hypothetical protein
MSAHAVQPVGGLAATRQLWEIRGQHVLIES